MARTPNDMLLKVYIIQILQSSWVIQGHVIPYKIKKEYYLSKSCLNVAGRIWPFMVEQVFLPMGEVWSMGNTDTRCTVWGEGRSKGREAFLCLNFSCLTIKHVFHVARG